MAALALEAIQVVPVQGGALSRELVGKPQRRVWRGPLAGHWRCRTVNAGGLAHAGIVEGSMRMLQPTFALHRGHNLGVSGQQQQEGRADKAQRASHANLAAPQNQVGLLVFGLGTGPPFRHHTIREGALPLSFPPWEKQGGEGRVGKLTRHCRVPHVSRLFARRGRPAFTRHFIVLPTTYIIIRTKRQVQCSHVEHNYTHSHPAARRTRRDQARREWRLAQRWRTAARNFCLSARICRTSA